MQAHVISFAVLLCLGVVLRLLHPGAGEWSGQFLTITGFLAAGSLLCLVYRARALAYLLLLAALSFFLLATPMDESGWMLYIWIFFALLAIAFALMFFKIKDLLPWTLSAIFLGFGVTGNYLDHSSITHVVNWAIDDFDDATVVYGTVIKEPEIRPEQQRTMLSISPSVVVRLHRPDSLTRFEDILTELEELSREWENEEEAVRTLIIARDRIAARPEEDPAQIVSNVFGAGLTEDEVESVLMALEELAELPASLLKKGWIWLTVVEPDDPEQREKYLDLSYHTGYGNLLKITTALRSPFPAANPGVFNYQQFLYSTHHYATMRADLSRDPDSIRILEHRAGNFFIAWCLDLKYRFLDTVRQVAPYPESSFLSGIFLGLRRGVTEKIMDDSRAAGTAHVFAVSGLHVTIITGLLLLLFNQTPIPKAVWAPIAVVFLFIFTVITGARPSTLRAAIMNSFALIFFTYFGKNIEKSLIMSICVAAIVILVMLPPGYGGPLLLPEASFLMSFSAVLFLGLLSRPVEHYLNIRLVGLHRFAIFAFLASTIGLVFINLGHPVAMFSSRLFWVLLLAIPACYLLQLVLPFRPRYTAIPFSWLRTFIAAQIAIQASIVPLSAVIFLRVSLAAPFANFIAIPLIGVVLPLGMIAAILGFIPFIGIQFATVMTAANYLGMNFFIRLNDFFTRALPYPNFPRPTAAALIIFYALIALFIVRERVFLQLRIAFARVKKSLPHAPARVRLIASGVLLVIGAVTMAAGNRAARRPKLEVTFLEMSWPGLGMSTLVETPGGENVLIDGGFEGRWGWAKRPVNQGERIVQDVLLAKRIVRLHAVVNTHLDPRLLGGLAHIVDSPDIYTRRLYAHLPPEDFGPQHIDRERFREALTPAGRRRAEKLYRLLLLGYWRNPVDVDEFGSFYRKAASRPAKGFEDADDAPSALDAFVDTLTGPLKFDAQDAIILLEDKKRQARERVVESIIDSYREVGVTVTEEEAEKIAADWDLPLVATEDYRELAVELPRPVLWFIYQEVGLLSEPAVLEVYLQELLEKFHRAARDNRAIEAMRPADISRLEERFLQYHRMIFAAHQKNIPVFHSHAGVNILRPREIGGREFEMVIIAPPERRTPTSFADNVYSTVISLRYGDVSFLFPPMINQQASENLLRLRGGIDHTVYLVPNFGDGGFYVNWDLMLRAVSPEVVVFQAGRVRGRALERFEEGWKKTKELGAKPFHTQVSGAVIVTTYGERYQVETILEEEAPPPDEVAPDRMREVDTAF